MTVAGNRRKFRREGEAARRAALIDATLRLMAEGGSQAATVRAIAEQAGVTPGLIRHYFQSKEDLTRAAYTTLMDRLTSASLLVLESAPADPVARLAVFVASSLRPPVVDAGSLGVWAAFIHRMQTDPKIRHAHEMSYLSYRDHLQLLISALPRIADDATLREQAIACTALIDGLWLEGSALPEAFEDREILRIGLSAVGAILDIDLLSCLHMVQE